MDSNTPALEALEGSGLAFEVVRTEPASSAEESAEWQGIPVEHLLRTIVVRRGAEDYVFVLVPGGRQIDWPRLRAHLGVSRGVNLHRRGADLVRFLGADVAEVTKPESRRSE